MPFFPLAGAEIVAIILLFAIGRWVVASWWRGELEDETLARWLPRRPPPDPEGGEPVVPVRPALRLIRGGRDTEPRASTVPRHARSPRDR